MNALVRKLTYIAEDCGFTYEELKPEPQEEVSEGEEQTEFNKRRHVLKGQIKDVEDLIKQRAEMEASPDCDKVEVVKMSTQIRKSMKEAIAAAEDLKAYHDNDVYKNRKKVSENDWLLLLTRRKTRKSGTGLARRRSV